MLPWGLLAQRPEMDCAAMLSVLTKEVEGGKLSAFKGCLEFAQRFAEVPANPKPCYTIDQFHNWLERMLDKSAVNLEKAKKSVDADPVALDIAQGKAHLGTALVLLDWGRGDAAEAQLNTALAIFQKFADHAAPEIAACKEQLAGISLMRGQLSEAEAYYNSVLVARKEMLGEKDPELARIYNNLGGIAQQRGDFAGAKLHYETALSLQTAALGPDAQPLATTLTNLGVLQDEADDSLQAEIYLLRAYDIRQKHYFLDDPLVLLSLDNLVGLYLKRGQDAKAEQLLQSARQQRLRTGAGNLAEANILDKLASFYMNLNNGRVAQQYMLSALELRRNELGEFNEQVAANLYNLGKLENIMGNSDQARIHLNAALDIYENQAVGNEAQMTAILSELFLCDFNQGKIEAAEEDLELMLTIKTTVYGDAHPETLAVMEEQRRFYQKIGNNDQADAIEAEMLKRKVKSEK